MNLTDFALQRGLQAKATAKPTNAQVDSATAAWLADHPEATTTVQDGAISLDKLDQALKRSVEAVEAQGRVESLDDTPLSMAAVNAVGIPAYITQETISDYADYGITDSGWYVFARIRAKAGVTATAQTAVTGCAGSRIIAGKKYVDIAVHFGVSAMAQTVTVSWGSYQETLVFRADDLAHRNHDFMLTFALYDAEPYAEWTYALTSDSTFTAGKQYYTKSGDVYTLATVTAGASVPTNTYYQHTKLRFSGMVKNVTYRLETIVDCPIEFILPEIPDDGHGAWYEIQMRYNGSYSCTLLPPSGVKIGTATTQAQSAGMNTIDLQYTSAGDVKMWTLLNTHANIPA